MVIRINLFRQPPNYIPIFNYQPLKANHDRSVGQHQKKTYVS